MRIQKILMILLVALTSDVTAENRPTYHVGLFEIPNNLNVIKDQTLPANILRSALYSPLVRKLEKNRIDFLLSDSFQRSADGLTSSFRLRKDRIFSNNKKILGTDVINSLENCMISRTEPGLDVISSRVSVLGDQADIWIDIKAKDKEVDVLAFLESCPIMDQEVAKIFGDLNGTATQLVGSGEYKLIGWEQGRRYSLLKIVDPNNKSDNQAEHTIDFMQIVSLEVGLAALRRGEIDLLFTSNVNISERVADDTTLSSGECNGERIVKRKNLTFNCTKYKISKLGYDL